MKVKKKLKKFNGYKSIREDKDLKFIKLILIIAPKDLNLIN